MARLRLNTRFFVIVMGVLVIGGVTVMAAGKWLNHLRFDPTALEKRGDEAMSAGDYDLARTNYLRASQALPKELGIRMKLGDALVRLTGVDPVYLAQAHRVWMDALAIDPTFKPALERLLTSFWEQVELSGENVPPGIFPTIHDRAAQLVKIDPANHDAKVWEHESIIRQAMSSQAVTDKDRDAALAGLEQVRQENPADAKPPYLLAQWKLRQSRDLYTSRAVAEARAARDQAVSIMDSALKGQDENAEMLYRAARIFAEASGLETVVDEDTKNRAKALDVRAGEAILKAVKSLKPTNKNFDDITLSAARYLATANKRDEARQVLQDFYKSQPNNQEARLAWAKDLSSRGEPAQREEAVRILSDEVPLPANAVGIGIIRHKQLQAITKSELIKILIAQAAVANDKPAERAKVEERIGSELDALQKFVGESVPLVLNLRGQFALLRDQPVEAVKMMEKAYSQMPSGQKEWDMVLQLARIYADRTQQPGRARQLCEEIVNTGRSSPEVRFYARRLLASLLINEKRFTEASSQIDALQASVNDPGVVNQLRQQLVLARSAQNPRLASSALGELPEKDNADRWSKVEFAHAAVDKDEEIRLLAAIIKQDSKDAKAVRRLALLYRANNQDSRAKQVVDKGVESMPDSAMLKLMQADLNGQSPAELRKMAKEQVISSSDAPKDKEYRLYELEKFPGGDNAEAMKHLHKSLELAPDDLRALDALFRECIATGKFDEAAGYIERLGKQNADQVGGRLFAHSLAMAKRDYEEAEKIGNDLVNNFREFAQSWMALGQAQEALAKWGEAITSLTEVLVRQPTHYEALRLLISSYYSAGRVDDAESKLRQMADFYPNDPTVRELLLNHLANYGKPDEAIKSRESLLRDNPNDARAYLALAATYFKAAQKAAAIKKADEARKNVELAFSTLGKGREKFPSEPRFYAQVAELYQYNGNVEKAEQILQAFAETERQRTPPRPDAWLALAEFFQRSGQREKLIQALREALGRSSDNIEIRLKLVSALTGAEKFDEAVATLDAVRSDDDPRVVRSRIEVLIAQKKLPEAEAAIRKTLSVHDSGEFEALLASCLIDTNRLDEALVAVNRAKELDPKNDWASYFKALILIRKRPADVDGAIAELVSIKRVSPESVPSRLLLADLYARTGRRQFAIQDLQDALAQNPSFTPFRLKLIELYSTDRPPKLSEAVDLIVKAETDPVMKTDPTWPREAARLYRQNHDYTKAVIAMRTAIDLSHGDVEFRREMVEMLVQLNDISGALLESDRLLKDHVDTWWLRLQRGLAYARLVTPAMLQQKALPEVAKQIKESTSKSIDEFDKAIALADENRNPGLVVEILRQMGQSVGNSEALQRVGPRLANDPTNDWHLLAIGLKLASGDMEGARADVERLLSDPSNGSDKPKRRAPILRAAAQAYQALSKPETAKIRQYYTELLTIEPDDMAALNNLACSWVDEQPSDPVKAKTFSERAYDLTRTTSDLPNMLMYDTHGWVLANCGGPDLGKGIEILKAAVNQSPYLPIARYHLGEALLRMSPPATVQSVEQLKEGLRLLDEDAKLGNPVDEKLRRSIQASLGAAQQAAAQ